MSRYTELSWKVSCRLDISLSDTGKGLTYRPYKPGQHGSNSHGKVSGYGTQLTEKQRLRHIYGVNERQFRMLFVRTSKTEEGKRGVNFMVLLKQRLGNVIYRLDLVTTCRRACQLVNHDHIAVDGKRVDIPPYHVEVGQVIGVREKFRNISTIKEAVEATVGRPAFVSSDIERLKDSFICLPERGELYPEIGEVLTVEYYGQKS